MISATRRALYGIRDTCGDDVVGCRRRRRGGQGRQRKRGARRKVRLLGLVLVVVVVGVALVLVRICSAARRGMPSAATTAATATRGGEGDAGMSTISVAAYGGEAWDRRRGDDGRALQDASTNAAEGCADNGFSDGGWGQVVLLVIAILFTFNGLAIVCDEFFQASLEKISEVHTAYSSTVIRVRREGWCVLRCPLASLYACVISLPVIMCNYWYHARLCLGSNRVGVLVVRCCCSLLGVCNEPYCTYLILRTAVYSYGYKECVLGSLQQCLGAPIYVCTAV